MSPLRNAAVAAALSVASMSAATNALAVPNRTAVSVAGTDSGNCAPAAPCRSIAYALTQTTPGGQMLVLNSGGYGPFTITQSVSIIAPAGVVAAVSAGSGDGITINAGVADSVSLEGFAIDGLGTGQNGITVNTVRELKLVGSKISGFTGVGLSFTPSLLLNLPSLTITNSTIYGTYQGSVVVRPSGNTPPNVVANVVLAEGSTFIAGPVTFDTSNIAGNIDAVLDNCIVQNMPLGGAVVANSPAGAKVNVHFVRSTMLFAGMGFFASGGGARIAIAGSTLTSVGVVAGAENGGQVGSYGNNNMTFVGSSGPLSTIPQH